MNKIEKMESLIAQLNTAAEAYYNGQEIMSNYEYDQLSEELETLEKETGNVLPHSPSAKVGADVRENKALTKVTHEFPALSLDKTKDISLFPKVFSDGDNLAVVMWKEDGSTLVATYDDGKLTQLVTRGNGYVGQDITHNAPFIHGLPLNIDQKGHVVVRGEGLMSYREFERLNTNDEYKNPRNLANATVSMQAGKKMENREIWFHAFKLVYMEDREFLGKFFYEMQHLEKLGFAVTEYLLCSSDYLIRTMEEFTSKVPEYEFPVDGLVVAANDVLYAERRPGTNKFPNRLVGFALKWEDEAVTSTLRKIEWSASRTGLLNPVAVFDPVEIEGTTVSRASVHNVSVLKDLKLRPGNTVSIIKANKIIPQIVDNLTKGDDLKYDESHPVQCPCCGADTEPVISDEGVEVSICPNPNCSAKHVGKYTHFVDRGCLNIVGISKATIEKFVGLGWIREFSDLYHLDTHREEIISMEGFGEKSYANMIAAIEKSRDVSFVPFLHSLGIPGIGEGQAKMLDLAFNGNVLELFDKIYSRCDFTTVDGIGDVLNQNLLDWGNQYLRWIPFVQDKEISCNCNREIQRLLKEIHIVIPEKKTSGTKLEGLTFVITGDVHHFKNRDEMKAFIEQNGGKTSGSVSGKTSYLINNDRESASGKNKKAKELGIAIISEDDFLAMM